MDNNAQCGTFMLSAVKVGHVHPRPLELSKLLQESARRAEMDPRTRGPVLLVTVLPLRDCTFESLVGGGGSGGALRGTATAAA